MPRYFFNTRIADELISDPEGEELRDPDRAWEIARAMIRELLKTEGAGALLNAVIEVTDDSARSYSNFHFRKRSWTSQTGRLRSTKIGFDVRIRKSRQMGSEVKSAPLAAPAQIAILPVSRPPALMHHTG